MDVRVVILSTVLDSDLPIQKLNSHRRCWGQWSMRWCRSSRRAVGWSTCSVPPESDCFCWRPAKQNGRAERSQCGPVGSAWMKWLFSPDGRVKANPSTLNEERKKNKKKGATQINGRSLGECNTHFTEQGRSICKTGWEGKKKNDKPPQGWSILMRVRMSTSVIPNARHQHFLWPWDCWPSRTISPIKIDQRRGLILLNNKEEPWGRLLCPCVT